MEITLTRNVYVFYLILYILKKYIFFLFNRTFYVT